MDPFLRRHVGKTRLKVPQLGMGGASLGDMRQSISEAQATATLEAAHAAGVGYFDTSPWYGNGKSELRFGHVLRTKPRGSFVLSTKVGRVHSRPADPDNYKHPAWVGGLPFELFLFGHVKFVVTDGPEICLVLAIELLDLAVCDFGRLSLHLVRGKPVQNLQALEGH